MVSGKKGSGSFLKKRTKKLFSLGLRCRGVCGMRVKYLALWEHHARLSFLHRDLQSSVPCHAGHTVLAKE
jgi:hypothetical protein